MLQQFCRISALNAIGKNISNRLMREAIQKSDLAQIRSGTMSRCRMSRPCLSRDPLTELWRLLWCYPDRKCCSAPRPWLSVSFENASRW